MSLTSGTRLGAYEVIGLIGQGGMGEVYHAHDTKLGRDVALKVLPDVFADDPERLARFQREARVLASLNHPNIASIYGLEEQDGVRALVLELVEGPTLAERIAQGAIPVEEALPIAKQIAEALEAAHERGVIHRDLKPANVKVKDDGMVKVLDFGLAKALEPESGGDPSESPTMTAAATKMGVIMGTAAYMSPEQAKGKVVDKRADVWAFGAVLYEMLTGQRPFVGDDVSDTLAAVVRADPDWSHLPDGLPTRGRDLLERCLVKESRDRWHDIADVRIELERVLRDPVSPRTDPLEGAPHNARRVVALGVTAFALGAFLAGTTIWSLKPAAPNTPRPVRFSLDVEMAVNQWEIGLGTLGILAMSPDGTRVAYVGARLDDPGQRSGAPGRQLYLRGIDESEGTPILGTEGASNLFFSPDGTWVGFVAGGKLQRVPVEGGAPLEICNARNIFGASWGPDDTIIFGGGVSSGLLQVPVAGGQPQPLTVPDPEAGEIHHGNPEILPDGRTVLFTVGTGEGSRIAKLSLDSGEWEELLPSGAGARYLSAGYLVFSENGNLRLVRFDAETGEVSGSVYPALDGVHAKNTAGLERAWFATSQNGDLAFVPGELQASLERTPVWVDRQGQETVIDVDRAFYLGPRFSPDGQRIAIMRLGELGIGEVWVMNADGSRAFPLAAEGADYNPVWTTDGTAVTYTSNGDIFEKRVDRDDARVQLLSRANYQFPRSWSPDGRFLAFLEASSTGMSIWVMSGDGEPEPLLNGSFNSGSPRFAPQGGWIAYATDESGQEEAYIRRYPGSDRGIQVSRGGGREPVWSHDGRELFYRRGDYMLAVKITTEPELEIGDPVELWERSYVHTEELWTSYDVSPDGRFLMLRLPDTSEAEPTRINVVLDWFSEVEARMQASN